MDSLEVKPEEWAKNKAEWIIYSSAAILQIADHRVWISFRDHLAIAIQEAFRDGFRTGVKAEKTYENGTESRS